MPMKKKGISAVGLLKIITIGLPLIHLGNREPEASGSQKRLVSQKIVILNMARPMKNSGTLPYMTFTEMAFKGHNQHSKLLNKQ